MIFSLSAKLPTDDQHEIIKAQRKVEIDHRRLLFKWGQDAAYSDLPGYVHAAAVDELPKDVQFTYEAALGLFGAKASTFYNKILMRLINYLTGHAWIVKRYDDYRRVLFHLTNLPYKNYISSLMVTLILRSYFVYKSYQPGSKRISLHKKGSFK